uniref:Uncharacterized protein n=1 Tax=Arundo donax TaxID=35708 RepID=A0A0A9GYQ7_ARUDO
MSLVFGKRDMLLNMVCRTPNSAMTSFTKFARGKKGQMV